MKEIPLTQGKVALVDDEDFEEVNQFKWCAIKSRVTFYAQRKISRDGKQTSELLHRRILKAKPSEDVDHENHNGLDCQRHNIRICTISQNAWNMRKHRFASSKFKGVYWFSRHQKWLAQIGHNGKSVYLGYFEKDKEEAAAHAYDAAAKRLFGEFAHLNFPIK